MMDLKESLPAVLKCLYAEIFFRKVSYIILLKSFIVQNIPRNISATD